MKLEVLQENLKKSLNLCSHFISPKAQLPILGNILMKTSKSKLILSSTNLETSISTSIGAKIEKEGEITVPGRVIVDIISNLSPGQISISSEKETVTIQSGSFKSTISGVNSSDFPKVPASISKTDVIEISKEDLIKALNRCSFAVSTDETRPVLTGILFIFKKKDIELVATDGFRLSKTVVNTLKGSEKGSVIIPKTILSEVVKTENGNTVLFSYDKKNNQVVFKVGESVFSSRIIEGTFPDFEKIIPKSSSYKLTLDKYELEQAVKLASVFAREAGNIVKFKIKKDNLSVFAESSSSGNQETDVEIKVETDESKTDLEIAYNYRFIEEFLKVVEGEAVEIGLTSVDKAGLFLDPKNSNFLHLIMPIKVQG